MRTIFRSILQNNVQSTPSPWRVGLSSPVSAALLAALMIPGMAGADEEKSPKLEGIPIEGFQQLMPRGGIPALVDPEFVSAEEAVMPDEAWVLGFERDGEAFAYDLNLLNRHEVVNHGTEATKFAAVWCPLANTAVVYSRTHGDSTYTFEPSGGLLHAALVMQDRETDTYWSILTEDAIYGSEKGAKLRQLSGSMKTTFGLWKTLHPKTKVLSVDGKQHVESSPYEKYFDSDEGFRGLKAEDNRLADKAEIYGFHVSGVPVAVPHKLFEDGGALIEFEDRKIFLYREKDDSHYQGTVAMVLKPHFNLTKSDGNWLLATPDGRDISFKPEKRSFGVSSSITRPITGFDTFWYQWSLTNPGTEIVDKVVLP